MRKFVFIYLGIFGAAAIYILLVPPTIYPYWWTHLDEKFNENLSKIPRSEGSFERYELDLIPGSAFQFEASNIFLEPDTSFFLLGRVGTFLAYQMKGSNLSVHRVYPFKYSNKEADVGLFKLRFVPNKTRLYYGFWDPDKETIEGQPLEKGGKAVVYVLDKKLTRYIHASRPISTIDPRSSDIVTEIWDPAKLRVSRSWSIAMSFGKKASLWLSLFIYMGLFMFGLIYLGKKAKRNIEEPREPAKMRALWQKGVTNFWCPHCIGSLKVYGQFKCLCEYIPPEPRYAFESCEDCGHYLDGVTCESCGRDVDFATPTYNPEEIQNRGKEYIKRSTPMKKYFSAFLIVLSLAYLGFIYLLSFSNWLRSPELIVGDWKSYSIFSDIFREMYGYFDEMNFLFFDPIFGPIYVPLFLIILALFIGLKERFKKVLIENPYDKKR